jgi:2-iminobutanoate/2-iminopropanoate deaminase
LPPRAAPIPRPSAPAISSSFPARSPSTPPPASSSPATSVIETRQTLNNVQSILEGCGATLADVVKCGVYLADGQDFAGMNEVYAEFFGQAKPARSTIACQFAVPGIKVEIDAVAYKPAA